MSATRAERLAALRVDVATESADVAYQVLFEDWLGREVWHLAHEGLPLLVGVDPVAWSSHLERHTLGGTADALLEQLAGDLDCAVDASVAPARLGAWAREHDCRLPAPFAQVLEFIVRVLPDSGGGRPADVAEARAVAAERELLLGAALTLVTRFPQQCRDEHGFFDGMRIADLILAKAALWFPLEPPALGRDRIAALLEQYLSR